MNQFGKNLVLAFCVVAALLVILGVKRKFSGYGEATLLSQPSAPSKTVTPGSAKSSPRPRVLQAKPVTQHEATILSPTSSQYADTDSETEASPAGVFPISPPPGPSAAPRALAAPELVPLDEPTTSPAPGGGDEVPAAEPFIETPTVPVATRPLPEFILTDAEDSFWTISERVYGSGVYYRALFRHNEAKVLRPDQLRAGIEVKTPPLEVLQELYPADFPQGPALTP